MSEHGEGNLERECKGLEDCPKSSYQKYVTKHSNFYGCFESTNLLLGQKNC